MMEKYFYLINVLLFAYIGLTLTLNQNNYDNSDLFNFVLNNKIKTFFHEIINQDLTL